MGPGHSHGQSANPGPAFVGAAAVIGLSLSITALSPSHQHWFMIPVTLCGIILAGDAVRWLRGDLDLLDPIGVIAALGMHFFYLAPILHVWFDYWLSYVIPPDDWRPWLGAMASLNVVSLVAYRVGVALGGPSTLTVIAPWRLHRAQFMALAAIVLVVAAALQIWVYARLGGVFAYMQNAGDRTTGENMGWIFMFSESFPIVAFLLLLVVARERGVALKGPLLSAVLLAFLALCLLFGGLRGSRATTVWALFWGVGAIHCWLRPIRRSAAIAGVIGVIVFMYVYGFYKSLNVDAISLLKTGFDRSELEHETSRTLVAVLLGDCGRSDVQAFLLFAIASEGSDYQYAWGRTYFGDVSLLVPRIVWPDRPPGKSKEGTEALRGPGTYNPVSFAQNIYGLGGEALMNFGPAGVPVLYGLLGLSVGRLARFVRHLHISDARRLIVPFLVILAFWALVADLDNVLWVLVKIGTVPCALIYLAARPRRGSASALVSTPYRRRAE